MPGGLKTLEEVRRLKKRVEDDETRWGRKAVAAGRGLDSPAVVAALIDPQNAGLYGVIWPGDPSSSIQDPDPLYDSNGDRDFLDGEHYPE